MSPKQAKTLLHGAQPPIDQLLPRILQLLQLQYSSSLRAWTPSPDTRSGGPRGLQASHALMLPLLGLQASRSVLVF